MNWVILLVFAFILPFHCEGNQDNKVTSSFLRQNLSDKSVRLDPLLRKALLRALTDLEKEATDRLRAEEARNIRSDQESTGNAGIVGRANEENQNSNGNSILATDVPNSPIIEESTISGRDNAIDNSPTTIENTFQYSTPLPLTSDVGNLGRESNRAQPGNIQDIASNFISDEGNAKNKNVDQNSNVPEENSTEKPKEGSKSDESANDVAIFKAPLVAAFTLHQDSKGTPHSVVPLFRPPIPNNQQLLEQQYALFKLQQQQQQFFQNQFNPNLGFSPLPQPNHFDQSRFLLPHNSDLSQSTIFPPLLSNSVIGPSFPSTVIPPHTFQSTTVPPLRNQNLISTIAPQRPISPQPFPTTLLPPQDFGGISVIPSHSINFSPTPPSLPLPAIPPAPALQPISIPPVTLPLQNEAKFQSPIIVPSVQLNTNQRFLESQEQQRLRNQLLLEEENRKRLLEEHNRQRVLEEQNRQRLLEEQNRQRLLEEQNRQLQLQEQNRQLQLQEQNRQRQLAEEKQKQFAEQNLRQAQDQDPLRQQRQEQNVDFQRSVGFFYNQNLQNQQQLRTPNNAFNYHVQPSQSFVSPVNFQIPDNRHRVNRQEAFGSTGNFGVSNNQGQRNFAGQTTQFQSNQALPPIIGPVYRTIPDEHYRSLPINQLQQSRYNQFLYQQQLQQQQQQQQQLNALRQNNVEDVNKKLKNLLYQSGVATGGSGQEDLNIVSKVLALNHQRSDNNVAETVLTNERRVDFATDKGLGVGEIKEQENTSKKDNE